MEVVVSHLSALHVLLANPNPRSDFDAPTPGRLAPCEPVGADFASWAEARLGLDAGPLDVLVSDPASRRRTARIASHLSCSPLPAGSLVPLGFRRHDVWVTSPELTFVQLAGELDDLGLIAAGNALCSAYRLDDLEPAGVVYRLDSGDRCLTCVDRLRGFVEGLAPGTRGRARALWALGHVLEGARSPVESGLGMAFGLSPLLGGFALGQVALNEPIRVYDGMGAGGRRTFGERIPDITIRARGWRGECTTMVDYDGAAAHGDRLRRRLDADRRNQLASQGRGAHFTIGRDQVGTYKDYLRQVDWIRISLGCRRKDGPAPRAAEVDSARFDLWRRMIRGELDPFTGEPVDRRRLP